MIVTLIIGALCCWRVTHLLNAEDGPGEILVRFRRLAGGGFFGQLLDCFYCLSLWVAAPLAALLATGWRDGLLLWLSISAAAILLERATSRGPFATSAPFYEEEIDHELLRESTPGRDGNADR
ncbi:MAG: hypothetical protein QOE68_4348 [Thermoanaerobaculia bacterium]|jgi:hypothetical protein|nr:hypothetical protein [Thermoanaerobaculia bacterium]